MTFAELVERWLEHLKPNVTRDLVAYKNYMRKWILPALGIRKLDRIRPVDLDHERDPEFGLFLRLGTVTGARRGGLCGLHWTDYDPAASEVVLRRALVRARTASR